MRRLKKCAGAAGVNRGFPSFTLIEVLVSLVLIAGALTAVLTVLAATQKNLRQDADVLYAVDVSNGYFTGIYVSKNLKTALFSADEVRDLSQIADFPYTLPVIVSNLSPDIQAIINRKIARWAPLLVNVGIEIVFYKKKNISGGTNVLRSFWFETAFSENYLAGML